VTLLIPAPSLTEQASQMMLAIIRLVEEQVATPEGYEDRLQAISMLAREAHNTIVDAELSVATKPAGK